MKRIKEVGVPRVLDFMATKNTCNLVLEYLNGGTLEQLLSRREKLLSEQEALVIIKPLIQLLCNLQYFSQKNQHYGGVEIVHRDIKPKNVLLNFANFPEVSNEKAVFSSLLE